MKNAEASLKFRQRTLLELVAGNVASTTSERKTQQRESWNLGERDAKRPKSITGDACAPPQTLKVKWDGSEQINDLVLDDQGSVLSYMPDFLTAQETRALWRDLVSSDSVVPWEQGRIRLYGKEFEERRLTCYFGEEWTDLQYSGRLVRPVPFDGAECPQSVRRLRDAVVGRTGVPFDSCLANWYRNSHDRIGWHSDDERLYGRAPVIAAISIGATRDFQIRVKPRLAAQLTPLIADAGERKAVTLPVRSGSLLIMSGQMQRWWDHAVPPRKSAQNHAPLWQEGRISLTFRRVVAPSQNRVATHGGGP